MHVDPTVSKLGLSGEISFFAAFLLRRAEELHNPHLFTRATDTGLQKQAPFASLADARKSAYSCGRAFYAATRVISAVGRYDCYVSVLLHGERRAGKDRWRSGAFLL